MKLLSFILYVGIVIISSYALHIAVEQEEALTTVLFFLFFALGSIIATTLAITR